MILGPHTVRRLPDRPELRAPHEAYLDALEACVVADHPLACALDPAERAWRRR
jgi:hypothetical protein